jgi:hypothetical protein
MHEQSALIRPEPYDRPVVTWYELSPSAMAAA